MANVTTVHITAGIPDSQTGTVSTIDNLIIVGLPLTGGTVALGGGTATVSGTVTAVVSGTVTAQISGGTSFISGGNLTSVINIGGAAVSSTNGFYSNLTQNNATLTPTNGLWANVMFNNAIVSASVGLPVNIVSGTVSVGNVTAAINQGGAAVSSTNGAYFNVLFNNTLVSATVGLPVNIVAGTAVISGTTFISGGNITAVVSGTAALNQGGAALSTTNGIYSNILLGNAVPSTSNALPVQLISSALQIGSVTAFVSGGNITAVVSGTTFISGGNVTAVVSGTTFISGGNVTSVVSGTVTAVVSGDTAAGVSDAGNPTKTGGLAKSANPTGVADGQRVAALFDLLGKQIVVQSIRSLKADTFTTINSTTQLTLIPAISTAFIDVYGCIVENTSGTAVTVTFRDATAATPKFELTVPPIDVRGFMISESGAYKQAAQNTTWTVQCNTAIASAVISVLYVKNTTS